MRSAFQIVADHYAASARGDLPAMMAEVAADVQWTEMAGFPCAGTHVGPARVIEKVFKVLSSTWEGYRFELESLIEAGNCVVGVGNYRGIYRQTGQPLDRTRRRHPAGLFGSIFKRPYPAHGSIEPGQNVERQILVHPVSSPRYLPIQN